MSKNPSEAWWWLLLGLVVVAVISAVLRSWVRSRGQGDEPPSDPLRDRPAADADPATSRPSGAARRAHGPGQPPSTRRPA